jgi:hypothetical protein
MTPDDPHRDVTVGEWLAVVEAQWCDAIAARERATTDRECAQETETEALREEHYWELLYLELMLQLGERP